MRPSAVGTLADTPLAHGLVYASNRRLTGRLELTAPDGRFAAIALWRGAITAVETVPASACPGGFFGTIAYELGLIDAAMLDESLLEIATTKRLHGEVLIERGAITSAQRDEVLVEQVHRKVHFLFSFPEATRYAFYDAKVILDQPPVAVDCIGPVWRGIRDYPPDKFVSETIRRVGDHALRATGGGSARLPAAEMALVRALAARPMTLEEMKRATELPASRVELLVYLLVISKCVEALSGVRTHPSTGALPVSMPSGPLSPSDAVPRASGVTPAAQAVAPSSDVMPATPAVAPSSGVTPAARAVTPTPVGTLPTPRELGVEGVRAYAEAVDGLGPFAVLGLPDGASIEAVRAAYFRRAKVWHPDRLPPELAAVRPEVLKIFARLADAHRMLCEEPAKRAQAGAVRATTESGPRPREAVLREARARMGRRDFRGVMELCQGLLDRDAEDAEALALHSWASVSGGEASDDAVRLALVALDRAVSFDRTCDRTVYHRGLAHKRLGNVPAAFRDFARALQLEPKNIDAEREVRLYAMRARKGSGERKLATSLLQKVSRRK